MNPRVKPSDASENEQRVGTRAFAPPVYECVKQRTESATTLQVRNQCFPKTAPKGSKSLGCPRTPCIRGQRPDLAFGEETDRRPSRALTAPEGAGTS